MNNYIVFFISMDEEGIRLSFDVLFVCVLY